MTPSIHCIQIPAADSAVTPLAMGGVNPQGREIRVNNRYLTLDGKPWLPVMGEFHFSRYPNQRWAEELLKMKAGGITVVATYVFWIHIEEEEGVLNWSGNNDLRHFIQLCDQYELFAYPRIGPWAHGECRNGGFPDWLIKRCGSEVRQDSPLYLQYVRRFYQEIAGQLQGLLWKDGGPVIGIQIENELLNNAGHIRTLKHMAQVAGLDVPLYTMTGWGPAQVPTDEPILPVFGGYPDAFWDRQVEEWSRASRKHYFFSSLRDDNTIGADLAQRPEIGDMSFLEQYPYGTCETGGGMQVSYHRRPLIAAEDISAIALSKVGSGSNLQGYYMYHGGANLLGIQSTMQESQATGYPNDLPVINYDFQAPLGQYGQVRESYHALRPLHLFLNDFGSLLAPLPLVLPGHMPENIDDTTTLRWAVRSDGRQGFLFINNYQRLEPLTSHEAEQFEIAFEEETLLLPSTPMRIPGGLQAILPLNFFLGPVHLKFASAQLICTLPWENQSIFVFSALDGIAPEFVFSDQNIQRIDTTAELVKDETRLMVKELAPGTDCVFTIHTTSNEQVSILVLNHDQARQLWKARVWGAERLFLSSEALYFEEGAVHIQTFTSRSNPSVAIFPEPGVLSSPDSMHTKEEDGIFARYTFALPACDIPLQLRQIQAAGRLPSVQIGPAGVATPPPDAAFEQAEAWYVMFTEELPHDISEVFLQIKYIGDCARAYLGGRLIDDDYFSGRTWEIGVSRFLPEILENGIVLKFIPLQANSPIYLPAKSQIVMNGSNTMLQIEQITTESMVDIILRLG